MRPEEEGHEARSATLQHSTTQLPPLSVRISHEIPLPKDWQDFQRNCRVLFRHELNDPNVRQFGRNGQNQYGIDLLGARDGNADHPVGIQCKLIKKPLNKKQITEHCRSALELDDEFREIIFATTGPNDTHASKSAREVEKELREEGHNVAVIYYGWDDLQELIAHCEPAYRLFYPPATTASPMATRESLEIRLDSREVINLMAERVADAVAQRGLVVPQHQTENVGLTAEDPALHAAIDIYRDMLLDPTNLAYVENKLRELRKQTDFSKKPWAHFRVVTNIAAAAQGLGREIEAAELYERAYDLIPEQPRAIANLAIARLIQGRYTDAFEIAQRALAAQAESSTVLILLQAAARVGWTGEPLQLIPNELRGQENTDLGIAEYIRWRAEGDWQEQILDLAAKHPACGAFKRLAAYAIANLAVGNADEPLNYSRISHSRIREAAETLHAQACEQLDIEYQSRGELAANVNNAAILLRLAGRHSDAEALIKRALPRLDPDPQLYRLLALAQASQQRFSDAAESLRQSSDFDNRLCRAELTAIKNPQLGLEMAIATQPSNEREERLRWLCIGEVAIDARDTAALRNAISGIGALPQGQWGARLMEVELLALENADDAEINAKLCDVADTLEDSTPIVARFHVAQALARRSIHGKAAEALSPIVQLQFASPITFLYLQSLAAGRHDESFTQAIQSASDDVKNSPATLWLCASHAWNAGNLSQSHAYVDQLLSIIPSHHRARMLKIDLMLREDDEESLRTIFNSAIEDEPGWDVDQLLRIAELLAYFGYTERAARLAYELFTQHNDEPQAWMAVIKIMLGDDAPMRNADDPPRWMPDKVGDNTAVTLGYDDNTERTFVIEPNEALRRLDREAIDPHHSVATSSWEKSVGDAVQLANERTAVIRQIRHKYVYRLHQILDGFEHRFPDISGVRLVNPHRGDDENFENLKDQLSSIATANEREIEQYKSLGFPLSLLALRLGRDPIDVIAAVVDLHKSFPVAPGTPHGHKAVTDALAQTTSTGCVMDYFTFWTNWRLHSLETVVEICGTVHLSQQTVDQLRARRDRFEANMTTGSSMIDYKNGQLRINEIPGDVFKEWKTDLDNALQWISENAVIKTPIIPDDFAAVTETHVTPLLARIYDAVLIARQHGLVLISDDFGLRKHAETFGVTNSFWSHALFQYANLHQRLSLTQFTQWTAELLAAGQHYLTVNSLQLLHALSMQPQAWKDTNSCFNKLLIAIGGSDAEPISHIGVCIDVIATIWNRDDLVVAMAVTGTLLTKLIDQRNDWELILLRLLLVIRRSRGIFAYVLGWIKGHFLPWPTYS